MRMEEVEVGYVYEGAGGLQKKVLSIDIKQEGPLSIKMVTFEVLDGGRRAPENLPVGSTHSRNLSMFARWAVRKFNAPA